MKRAVFQDLLDLYGADLGEWPPQDRTEALKLLEKDAEARGLHAQSRRLEALLEQGFERSINRAEGAAARILARLETLPAQDTRDAGRLSLAGMRGLDGRMPRWPSIAALTLAAALGIMIGYIGAGNQAVEGRQRISFAVDGADTDLNAVLFETDPAIGLPR